MMSEIISVWFVDTDEATFVFDSEGEVIDFLGGEVKTRTWTLGNELDLTIRAGEMQRHEFEALGED
jgi:hypothetical protein